MSRRGHGSTKVPNVKLRPAQVQQSTQVNNAAPEIEVDNEEDFGLREELRGESKPLDGAVVCITGIRDARSELQGIALALGAHVKPALTADATHLIAETTSTPKYKCAVEYGINIMKPAWLYEMREVWLQGEFPDVPSLSCTHRLRPLHGLQLSLTAFTSDPEQRNEIFSALAAAGATYKPTFVKSCTHLIVGPEIESHEVALQHPKVIKAQEFNALNQSLPPEKQKHNIHVVWSSWLDDSLALQGALDETKYLVTQPKHSVQRVLAIKSLETDQPIKKASPKNSLGSRRESTTLADDSKVNPLHLSQTKPVTSSFNDVSWSTVSRKREPSSIAHEGDVRSKKHKVSSTAALSKNDVHQLLNLDDDSDEDSEPKSSKAAQTRSLTQLAPPRPPTAPSSQLSRLTSKSSVRSGSQAPRSQPFAAASGQIRRTSHIVGDCDSTPRPAVASKSSSPRNLINNKLLKDDHQENGFLEGLRFALCDLEPAHIQVAQRVIQEYGGHVVRTAASLAMALDDDVDYVITKLLHPADSTMDVCNPKLIAQSWLEKCVSVEGFVEPDSFWAGRPVKLGLNQNYLEVRLTLSPKLLQEFDLFILERLCCNIGISFRAKISSGWTTHVLASDLTAVGGLGIDTSDVEPIHISQFLGLLQSLSNSASHQERHPPSAKILAGCTIALSKKISTTVDRKSILERIDALGAKHVSAVGPEVTHLIHLGEMRGPDIRIAQSQNTSIVHPLWLEECLRLKRRALERAFPSTFQPGSALSFSSMPTSTAPSRLQRQVVEEKTLLMGVKDDTKVAHGSVALAHASTDDELPPPLDICTPGRHQHKNQVSSTNPFAKSKSQPRRNAGANANVNQTRLDPQEEIASHPADQSFEPIVPPNLLESSPVLRPPEKAAALSKSKGDEGTGIANSPPPEERASRKNHVLSGLKSLFDLSANSSRAAQNAGGDVEQDKPRKQRRTALSRRASSPTFPDRSDDSDAFAPSDYIHPHAGQKRARSAFEMTQVKGCQVEDTQAEEQSLQITVVDPAAREAKLRLLGQPVSPVKEIDPSSGDDFMVIPGPSTRRSGRARRYIEERI